MKAKYVLPGVTGRGMTAFYASDGTQVQIMTEDGAYVLNEPDPKRRAWMARELERAGFRHAGEIPEEADDGSAGGGAAGGKRLEERVTLMHPDNTPGNTIDTTIKLKVKGEEREVKIERGLVETDDPDLVKALRRKGYILQTPHAAERAGIEGANG